jgi:hypothetical protein
MIHKYQELKMKVGEGYIFAFCDAGLGDDDDYIGFVVVTKKFFEENGHLESVEFPREMPPEFEESMESMFIVESSVMNEDQVRAKLIELGFEESIELTD